MHHSNRKSPDKAASDFFTYSLATSHTPDVDYVGYFMF